MHKNIMASMLFGLAFFTIGLVDMNRVEAAEKTGEILFNDHCAMCHPDGGNIISPKKTLMKKDLSANNIRTAEDVITFMRKPGPGMTAFDRNAISDKEAKRIADFILKKYGK